MHKRFKQRFPFLRNKAEFSRLPFWIHHPHLQNSKIPFWKSPNHNRAKIRVVIQTISKRPYKYHRSGITLNDSTLLHNWFNCSHKDRTSIILDVEGLSLKARSLHGCYHMREFSHQCNTVDSPPTMLGCGTPENVFHAPMPLLSFKECLWHPVLWTSPPQAVDAEENEWGAWSMHTPI